MIPTPTSHPVIIETDDITLLAVIGNLQLGLSHPQNTGPSSKIVKDFINQLTPHLSKINPMYQIIIEAGFQRGSLS